jgi:hypothetical protein
MGNEEGKLTITALIFLYTNTVSSTFIGHVSVSQGLSSGVHAVARKLLHCWLIYHKLRIKFFSFAQTNYFYCAQNLKIERLKIKSPCGVAPLLISRISLLVVVVCVCVCVYVLVPVMCL